MNENMMNELLELEKLADREVAHNDVLDIFHRYIHYYGMLHIEGALNTFSKEKDDVSLEVGEEGIAVGLDKIREYFGFMPKLAKHKGVMIYHYTTTPVVEIAGDGMTAKITCFAPGFDAMAEARLQNWVYGKYYVDLTKDSDGKWRLWHVRWFRTFEATVTEGWLAAQTTHDQQYTDPALIDVYEGRPALAEGTYPADWKFPKHYDPEAVNYLMPEPAKPYETYDGVTAMDYTRGY